MAVQKAMNDEIQGIDIKNNALGAIWAGLTAALSAANGLYNSLADNPNKIATALLAFGATGSAIPTFFYFGSDKRQAVVKEAYAKITTSLAAAQTAQQAIQQAVLNLNAKRDLVDAANQRLEFLNGTTCPKGAKDCAPTGGEIKRLTDELSNVGKADTDQATALKEQIKKLKSEADTLPSHIQDLLGDVATARATYQASINTYNQALIDLRSQCN